MNITFLLTQSLDSPSGLGRYAPLARELCILGHRVTILALHPDYSNLKDRIQENDGLQIRYVSQMHVRKEGDTKSYFSMPTLLFHVAVATWRMSLAALRTHADIIHVGKPHPMNGIAGWISHLLGNGQLWLDCDDYEAASGQFSNRYQQNVVAWFEKWLPKRAQRVTVNTNFMREKLISWGILDTKIIWLPNGVDRSRFQQPDRAKLEDLRVQFKLEQKKVIAFIGSLSLPSHPVDLLMKAFTRILREIPQTVLLLVGGGEDYEYLKSLARELGIADNVIFSGRVRPEEVAAYYQIADITVDPVNDDDAARGRSPLKCFESWAAGTPFVTADVGDRRRLLGEPPAGLLSKPGDPASLAHTILTVLTDPDLSAGLTLRGSQRVELYYWDQLAPSLSDAYFTQSGILE